MDSTPFFSSGEKNETFNGGILQDYSPAEIGLLRDHWARRRHLAATLIDLANRGYIKLVDSGNEAELGEALDWLILRNETNLLRRTSGKVLLGHEKHLLELIGDTPGHLLSRIRASSEAPTVLRRLRADARLRGWVRERGLPLRTRAGRGVLREVNAARVTLSQPAFQGRSSAHLLPQAVALNLTGLWIARLAINRAPLPLWFQGGAGPTARGWLGIESFVLAASKTPPPGGGAGASLYPRYP